MHVFHKGQYVTIMSGKICPAQQKLSQIKYPSDEIIYFKAFKGCIKCPNNVMFQRTLRVHVI